MLRAPDCRGSEVGAIMNKGKTDFSELYKSVRRKWTRNPVTRIKGNKKAEMSKKACRVGKANPGRYRRGANE